MVVTGSRVVIQLNMVKPCGRAFSSYGGVFEVMY
jgi:hypothetical protein